MTETNTATGLTPEAVDTFARGLYHLAKVDGMEPRERKLIEEFLAESQSVTSFAELETSEFSPLEAALVLESTWLRHVFIKAAIALVKADGKFSDAERRAVGKIADAFGLTNAEFGDLEQEASREALE